MRVSRMISKAASGLVVLVFSVSAITAGVKSLKLNINAQCFNGFALFQIVNKGERLPDSAMFNVYRAVDRTLINSRRLRRAKDKHASFRISKGAHPGEELAIYVEPGWYKRASRFDGGVVCR